MRSLVCPFVARGTEAGSAGKRELGRGERILPGVFRLRLPLPWPGVPHCNAWAISAGDGFVLFDTGMHQPGSMDQLQWALASCRLRIEDVKLIVCTHAHSDHCGQAPAIKELTGCELWMHPKHTLITNTFTDPEAELARRLEIARQSGVPEEPLRQWAAQRQESQPGISGPIEPDRDLVPGVTVQTDLGEWTVHETPGHDPCHVCLFQAEQRVLISGDHLLGRISLFFDYGHSPDPVGEYLDSLDVVQALRARLCLAGHGRTFTDVQPHIDGSRALVRERLEKVRQAVSERPLTAVEALPSVSEGRLGAAEVPRLLMETLAMLTHLEAIGAVERTAAGAEQAERQLWVAR